MADQAPYGTWRSSLTAQDVARVPRLRTVVAEDSGAVWWQKVLPSQGGRASVMRGGRGAEAAKMLVADSDAIGFREGVGPWRRNSPSTVRYSASTRSKPDTCACTG